MAIHTTKIWNELKVVKIDYDDTHTGTVKFETLNGRQFPAMFSNKQFKLSNSYFIKFCSLDYPLEWDIIFSGNKNHQKLIEPDSRYCSFIAYGQILSTNPIVADFGDILLELGEWSNDPRVIGEFIYWKIDRLDVLEVKSIPTKN